ncbi:MFS general substrate transporter [Athelia psychrophila]|uniref:MFS general substrate transporter n=1 Tax=Athelia psychrophila TaxID=1759441 RepID=A0A166M4Q5_9AGAM|nr:MFS general substrate transporter [Fibularhizoctonia sp. CBS 109695]
MTRTDESTPLLSDERVEDIEARQKLTAVTPLPKLQLGKPIAYAQIFPYINEYMDYLHVTNDPKRIGFYSGLVESAFALFQLVAIYNMAKLSDNIGRRPVLFCGVFAVGITTILFGLSTSFPMMMVIRALTGLCSGNSAVSLTVVGELSDDSNIGLAMSIYAISWPLGAIIGPLLGGGLANPAAKYQWLDLSFLREYPYFLPGAVSGVMTLTAVAVGYFFLEETLPKIVHSRQSTEATACSETNTVASDESQEPLGIRELLSIPIFFNLAGSGFALSFLTTAFEVLFALYSYTDIENGGLGFPPAKIGYALAVSGILLVLLQVIFMPWILRTFDKAKMYNLTMWLFLCLYPLLSVLNLIARSGYNAVTGEMDPAANAVLWAVIVLILIILRIANLGYSFSMILIKELCPNPASLGVSNGLITFVMSMARAFGPAISSSMFAVSVEHNLLGGFAWVIPMFLISMAGVYQSTRVCNMSTQKK